MAAPISNRVFFFFLSFFFFFCFCKVVVFGPSPFFYFKPFHVHLESKQVNALESKNILTVDSSVAAHCN